MVDITKDFIKTVGKHFLSFSCVQLVENERKPLIFSGFLIDALGAWFFVTAGHILRDINTVIDAGYKFDTWRFDDQTSRLEDPMPPIPFDFSIEDWVVIYDKVKGLDYAVLALDDFYIRQLLAGGAEPIRKNAWGDYIQDHDFWAIMGIPSESVTYDGVTELTAKFSVIPLEETDPPPNADQRSENSFYARLDPSSNVKDIDGMSGGPIFTLKKIEGKWVYHVIGVQSGWYPQSRVIFACPIKPLFLEIEELVETISNEAT